MGLKSFLKPTKPKILIFVFLILILPYPHIISPACVGFTCGSTETIGWIFGFDRYMFIYFIVRESQIIIPYMFFEYFLAGAIYSRARSYYKNDEKKRDKFIFIFVAVLLVYAIIVHILSNYFWWIR